MTAPVRPWEDIIREDMRFPFPEEIPTIPGTEGWERMYSRYLLFTDERKEWDKNQWYFYDKMHFPNPMYPFDLVQYAWNPSLSGYTTRVFTIPPANGLVGRLLNGYFFIAPQAVADPEIIGKKVPHFQKRTAFYYENWNELYERWVPKMRACIEELKAIQFKDLPEFEPESTVLEAKGLSSGYRLLDNYHKLVMVMYKCWQYHFEFLNLVYLAYVMFYDFCQKAFPDIADNTIAKLVAGAPGLLMFQPDLEITKLARLAVYLGVADIIKQEIPAEEIIAKLNATDQGKRWLEAMDNAKDPWFYTSSGTGFFHTDPSWNDDLNIPFSHLRGYIGKLEKGEAIDRPVEALIAERERLHTEYRALLGEEDKKTFDQSYSTLQMAYPYAENHIFYVEHWFQSLYWNKGRELGQVLANAGFFNDPEDVFYFNHNDVASIVEDLFINWAHGPGVPAASPGHLQKEVDWRKGVMQKMREWRAPPALGPVPEAIYDPFCIQLWGFTKGTLDQWLAPRPKAEDVTELKGFAASSGVAEGPARVLLEVADLDQLQPGEVLVCPVTSPSWAPAFLKMAAAVTDLGGMSSHAAIVCREYALPSVVGTGFATNVIKTGDILKVDGSTGVVTIVKRA